MRRLRSVKIGGKKYVTGLFWEKPSYRTYVGFSVGHYQLVVLLPIVVHMPSETPYFFGPNCKPKYMDVFIMVLQRGDLVAAR